MSQSDRFGLQDRVLLEVEDMNTHLEVAGAFLFEAGPLTRPEGGLDTDRIREYVASRLYRIPRYRQRVEYVPFEGHPVWVDDANFNIQYHVRHTRLPLPGDERQLKRLCGLIFSQQLDRRKPLWELWVVEGLDGDRFALVPKNHHCMIDGISGVDLLETLLTPEPAKVFDPGPTWLPRPTPEQGQLLRDELGKRMRAPLALGNAMLRAIRKPRETFERAGDVLAGFRETRNALATLASETPLNRPIGPHRRFDWLAMDLDAVKRVKQKLGGTVNDVVLATSAGAIGHFLELRGVTQREQEDLDFRAACPVSTRADAERGRLGNQVAGLVVPLPIAERDPRRRLATVIETMERAKDSKQTLAAESISALGEWTSPRLFSALAKRNLSSRTYNLNISNIPGPPFRLHLLGARMTETYPAVPLTLHQALSIGIFSYSGGLFWGLNSDWDQLPDLHDLVLSIDKSFVELCEAAEGE